MGKYFRLFQAFLKLLILAFNNRLSHTSITSKSTFDSIYPPLNYTGKTSQFTLFITRYTLPGKLRQQVTVNRSVPGPTLYLSLGDSISVTVINEIHDDATAVHWHGMSLINEGWNDGVINVTQCPISNIPGFNSMVYRFTPQSAGTFWYHGHYHSQYPDGLYGALVVLDNNGMGRNSLLATGVRYDIDDPAWILQVADYFETEARYLAEQLLASGSNGFDPIPDAITVNNFFTEQWRMTNVSRSKSLRMRIINAAAFSTYTFSIDGLPLTLIEMDGTAIEPLEVAEITLHVSQRASVIIDWSRLPTDLQNSCSLWVRFVLDPTQYPQYNPNAFADNMLGSTSKQPLGYVWKGQIVFATPAICSDPATNTTPSYNPSHLPLVPGLISGDANTLETVPLFRSVPPPALYSLRAVVTMQAVSAGMVLAFINGATAPMLTPMIAPVAPTTPLLFRFAEASGKQGFATTLRNGNEIQGSGSKPFVLPFNEAIDIIIDGNCCGTHPFHLHGHHFWIMATSERPNFEEDANGSFPVRDVVVVPFGGWARIRIVSNNPGIWLLHCHLHWHMELGLTAMLIEAPDELQRRIDSGEMKIPNDQKKLCKAPTAIVGLTSTPTLRPSKVSTANPSSAPSVAPTLVSYETPSDEPTEEPTDDSLEEPTEEPTDEPSEEPSDDFLEEPTEEPSEEPTDDFLEEPTDDSLEDPTDDSLEEPTLEPTVEPTEEPTASISPSKYPSQAPDFTLSPSAAIDTDTATPTRRRSSHRPSQIPTLRKSSAHPSYDPSNSPSIVRHAEIALVSLDITNIQPRNAANAGVQEAIILTLSSIAQLPTADISYISYRILTQTLLLSAEQWVRLWYSVRLESSDAAAFLSAIRSRLRESIDSGYFDELLSNNLAVLTSYYGAPNAMNVSISIVESIGGPTHTATGIPSQSPTKTLIDGNPNRSFLRESVNKQRIVILLLCSCLVACVLIGCICKLRSSKEIRDSNSCSSSSSAAICRPCWRLCCGSRKPSNATDANNARYQSTTADSNTPP